MLKNLILGIFTFSLLSVGTAQAEKAWESSKNEEGIEVFVAETPESSIESFKGVTTLPARLASIVAVLQDTDAFPKLLHNCKSAKTLQKVSDKESYKYILTGMPWPVENRDAIVHSVLTQDPQSKQIKITLDSEPQNIPKVEDVIRIKKMQGSWLLSPAKEGVKVEYEMSIDPAGSLPIWLVNSMVIDIPFNTLKKLRDRVKEAHYKNAKLSYIAE